MVAKSTLRLPADCSTRSTPSGAAAPIAARTGRDRWHGPSPGVPQRVRQRACGCRIQGLAQELKTSQKQNA
jgi:hypothetical protein